MKKQFETLGQNLYAALETGEEISLQLSGEETLYIRYNAGKVRQNTQVEQYEVTLLYKNGKKFLSETFGLGSDVETNLKKAQLQLIYLRAEARNISESPFQPEMVNYGHTEMNFKGKLPSVETIFEELHQACEGTDFCGLVASGKQVRGTQNSKGQFHWFANESFFVDYSLYCTFKGEDRAVKSTYAGSEWSTAALKENIQRSKEHLEFMKRPTVHVPPGNYRVFLEPAAVAELTGYLSYQSWSFKNFKSGEGLLIDLGQGRKNLNPSLSIQENFELGLVPPFNSLGEVSPANIPLVQKGKFKNWLTSTASAREFKVESNQAAFCESPRSLEILPGELRRKDIMSSLGTGLYLANLHYVNASDQKTARLTGMTRFAAFWVEKGEIVGPIDNLRFDVSLYEVWGPKLLALTSEAEVIPEVSTYGARGLGGNKLPGMLIDQFSFTL